MGVALNSVDDMTEADLGYADTVYEQVLGDDKFTFIEGVKNPKSVTILIKGPNDHIDVLTGEPCSPVMEGIYDNYCVKKQMLNLTPVLAQQLLLVDEVIRAGRQMGGK